MEYADWFNANMQFAVWSNERALKFDKSQMYIYGAYGIVSIEGFDYPSIQLDIVDGIEIPRRLAEPFISRTIFPHLNDITIFNTLEEAAAYSKMLRNRFVLL
jgi:hypothetical protein